MASGALRDAVILVGGQGLRLRAAVPGIPKPLAPVRGIPFLRFVLDNLDRMGIIRHAVFTLGYHGDLIEAFVRAEAPRWRLTPRFSREAEPLGTGGGLRTALAQTDGEAVFAVNGDTFLDFSPASMETALARPGARIALAACRVPDARRFGTLGLAGDADPAPVTSFQAEHPGAAWINGGVYLLEDGDA